MGGRALKQLSPTDATGDAPGARVIYTYGLPGGIYDLAATSRRNTYMNRIIKSTAIASALLMTMGSAAAFANTADGTPPAEDAQLISAPAEVTPDANGMVSLRGALVYNELETGFYEVNGYRLIGDENLWKSYKGGIVDVKGKLSTQPSIFMTKAIEVTEVVAITRGGAPTDEIPAPMLSPIHSTSYGQAIIGQVEYVNLEGGFYSVGGYGLKGNNDQFKALLGKEVLVTGLLWDGMSGQQVTQWQVEHVARRVLSSGHQGTVAMKVNGKMMKLDQGAMVVNGTLMVPLRAVIEAAGGHIQDWDNATQTATVRFADRTAMFAVGQAEAEMIQDHVRYLVRNMLKVDKATTLVNGRTMVSADALSKVLGMWEIMGEANSLEIVTVNQ
jgi:hypothetical protein